MGGSTFFSNATMGGAGASSGYAGSWCEGERSSIACEDFFVMKGEPPKVPREGDGEPSIARCASCSIRWFPCVWEEGSSADR